MVRQMIEKYDVYSKFDIEKHVKTFINYLEVVIDENGVIEYAVPSHQEYLIKYACNKLNISRYDLEQLCPIEYFGNFTKWLCIITNCISVWNDFCLVGNGFTKKQLAKLKELKIRGLYKGLIPKQKNDIMI